MRRKLAPEAEARLSMLESCLSKRTIATFLLPSRRCPRGDADVLSYGSCHAVSRLIRAESGHSEGTRKRRMDVGMPAWDERKRGKSTSRKFLRPIAGPKRDKLTEISAP